MVQQEKASIPKKTRSDKTHRATTTDSTRWKAPCTPIPFTIIKKGDSIRATRAGPKLPRFINWRTVRTRQKAVIHHMALGRSPFRRRTVPDRKAP